LKARRPIVWKSTGIECGVSTKSSRRSDRKHRPRDGRAAMLPAHNDDPAFHMASERRASRPNNQWDELRSGFLAIQSTRSEVGASTSTDESARARGVARSRPSIRRYARTLPVLRARPTPTMSSPRQSHVASRCRSKGSALPISLRHSALRRHGSSSKKQARLRAPGGGQIP
jgi:hypothetical protein